MGQAERVELRLVFAEHGACHFRQRLVGVACGLLRLRQRVSGFLLRSSRGFFGIDC